MRITNSHLTSILGGTTIEVPAPEESPRREAASASLGDDAHVPSQELQRWLALVREQPEVRAELVALVTRKLAEGFYETSSSAQQTAEAILNSHE
ncbi:MAG: flagellar biosynthesis anti-sigma factor FlgM [Planctomycetes bacterium]|nr:flagellar biosynthesis anti-sigma factor FlgM [Planctomycetota bacterium]